MRLALTLALALAGCGGDDIPGGVDGPWDGGRHGDAPGSHDIPLTGDAQGPNDIPLTDGPQGPNDIPLGADAQGSHDIPLPADAQEPHDIPLAADGPVNDTPDQGHSEDATPPGHHPGAEAARACLYARATRYPIHRLDGVPQGTCSFGPVASQMPLLFQEGYVTAPNEYFYNKSPRLAGACGECYELTGSTGTITVMAADICDVACCDNCHGDVVAFDVEAAHWEEIVDQTGGNVAVAYRLVPCPVQGNIRAYFTSGWQGGMRFRLVVYNHRIGVDRLEVRGSPQGATGGVFVPLMRTQDNYFDWDLDPQQDVGLPMTLRVISTQGQAVEFPSVAELTSDMQLEALGQFDDQEPIMLSCEWPGPERVIFDDALGGILGLEWRDWGSYLLDRGLPDYACHQGCFAGEACIDVGPIQPWGAIQVGFPTTFPPPAVRGIEFSARTYGEATSAIKFYYSGQDASGEAARSDMVPLELTGQWQRFAIDFAPLQAEVDRMQVVRWTNQSNDPAPGLMVDEIRLME